MIENVTNIFMFPKIISSGQGLSINTAQHTQLLIKKKEKSMDYT